MPISDFAGDQYTRKSTTGLVIRMNEAPISWKSKRQTITALSSAEAKYVALSTCAKEAVRIRRLIWEPIRFRQYDGTADMPITAILSGNTTAISMAPRDPISAKSKHIEIKYHHVKDLIKFKVQDSEFASHWNEKSTSRNFNKAATQKGV